MRSTRENRRLFKSKKVRDDFFRGLSVTDSFHGCLFATAARRPFFAYPQGASAERILDVTSRYALGDRVIAGRAPA